MKKIAASDRVELFSDETATIDGETAPPLAHARFMAVLKIVKSAGKALSKDELGEAGVKALKRAARLPAWGEIIDLPGTRGGKYRVK